MKLQIRMILTVLVSFSFGLNWTALLAVANKCFYGVPQGCLDNSVIGAYLNNAEVWYYSF